jgi:hypothetical protein
VISGFYKSGMQFLIDRVSNTLIMYTLQDFRIMPFEKKCDVITFNGSYLTTRVLGDCKVFLYHASEFFIEVFYSPKHQKVLMINAFDKIIGLDPYLEKISLVDLRG